MVLSLMESYLMINALSIYHEDMFYCSNILLPSLSLSPCNEVLNY